MSDLSFLKLQLLTNSLQTWLIALGTVLVIVLGVAALRSIVGRRLRAMAHGRLERVEQALAQALGATRLWLILLVALYFGSQELKLPEQAGHIVGGAVTVAGFLQLGYWCAALLDFWATRSRALAMESDPGTATSFAAISLMARIALWSVVVLLALENVGVNVTGLVAGLGIGGVAIGLAAQSTLGDLFAGLAALVDKPYMLGDFIIVESYMGTVEYIGLKTTRLRSLGGEQLIFSNSDLAKARVHNYKRMRERRIVFTFGVLYQTSAKQLEAIPGMVREAVEALDTTRFDRAHFKEFGDSSYNFEVVYWMLDPDYTKYMDAQQAINLALVRRFEQEGIEFAYPTRTLHFATPLTGMPA